MLDEIKIEAVRMSECASEVELADSNGKTDWSEWRIGNFCWIIFMSNWKCWFRLNFFHFLIFLFIPFHSFSFHLFFFFFFLFSSFLRRWWNEWKWSEQSLHRCTKQSCKSSDSHEKKHSSAKYGSISWNLVMVPFQPFSSSSSSSILQKYFSFRFCSLCLILPFFHFPLSIASKHSYKMASHHSQFCHHCWLLKLPQKGKGGSSF